MRDKSKLIGFRWVAGFGVIAGLTGCSAGDEASPPSGVGAPEPLSARAAAAQLKAAHPRAQVQVLGNRIRRVYGAIGAGRTPDASAESFRQSSAELLGVERDELVPTTLRSAAKLQSTASPHANGVGLMYDRTTGKYKFRLYTYQQQRDGIPVFRGGLRTLVREDGNNPVVWANSDVRPMGNFRAHARARAGSIDVQKSLRALGTNRRAAGHGIPVPAALTDVSTPTETIFAGVDGHTASPRLALEYSARAANGPGKWTFVADAATGDILHVESNLHFDIDGSVRAEVITGPESRECGSLGIAPLPHAQVTSAAGDAFTDASGAFTIQQSGGGNFSIVSDVTGRYFDVNDAGSSDTITLNVTPPGPADFLHRDTQVPPERVLAQLNAYKAANEIRDLLLSYVPEYPVIATELDFRINVNQSDQTCDFTGGAWYDDDNQPRTLNFCVSTVERANTAFQSIVHHEYGHHVVDSGGSGQGEYGEGMSDAIAALFAMDPRIGVGYHLNQCSAPLRTVANTCQFDETNCSSCGSGLYECGSLISGTIWSIWQELGLTEPASSDDIIRSLVFSSIPMHSGSTIDESIAIDFLTLDDDDGLIENGTPHYLEICAGFEQHGMNCPAIADGLVVKGNGLDAEGPSDGPFAPPSASYTLHNLGPQQSLTYSVMIPSGTPWLTVSPASGTIPLGGQATVTVSIDQAQAALLADGDYTATLQFVNQSSGVGTVGREVQLRVGAPVPVYTATFDSGLEGFTPDTEYGNLWHQSTACVDSLPGHTSPGSLYYGRDDRCNFTTPVPIPHTITSPIVEIGNRDMAELGFKYYLRTENSSDYDSAEVRLSVNDGAFQTVASNNRGGEKLNETTAWQELRFGIADRLAATGLSRLRLQFAFNAGDINSNGTTGFVLDDVTFYAKPECSSNAQCDDGNPCTTDACTGNACIHTDNGSCNLGPCANRCANPTKFGTNGYNSFQSGNLGTNATCHETTGPLNGGVCGNFVNPRRLTVNGVPMKCDWTPWASRPQRVNGGYCIQTTAGNHPWAAFASW